MLFYFKFHLFVQVLNQTGNEDLCYYNFLCAHPLGLLSGNCAPHLFRLLSHCQEVLRIRSAFILVGWIRIRYKKCWNRIRIGSAEKQCVSATLLSGKKFFGLFHYNSFVSKKCWLADFCPIILF
jgi:hypothetical protein